MIIRPIKQSDAAGVETILRELGWFYSWAEESQEKTVAYVESRIQQCLADESHSIYVAVNEWEEVVAYAAVHWLPYLFLEGPEGYVSELFVSEARRGKGIGSSLLDHIKKEALNRGCSRLSLINSKVRDSYKRGFYRQRGWVERTGVANFVLPLKRN